MFLAASHPLGLAAAGRTADGVFLNFGLGKDNIAQSEAIVAKGISEAGRSAGDVEIWQIGALDCALMATLPVTRSGRCWRSWRDMSSATKILKRVGSLNIFASRSELRRRYSTRPGDADIRLVRELGLFDYLSGRLSICGTPEQCLKQALAAKAAGAKRLMLTVSLASDPVRTVELFGEHVLLKLRNWMLQARAAELLAGRTCSGTGRQEGGEKLEQS
mgnify:CR=1 FL=1